MKVSRRLRRRSVRPRETGTTLVAARGADAELGVWFGDRPGLPRGDVIEVEGTVVSEKRRGSVRCESCKQEIVSAKTLTNQHQRDSQLTYDNATALFFLFSLCVWLRRCLIALEKIDRRAVCDKFESALVLSSRWIKS